MKKFILIIATTFLFCLSCQKEKITLGTDVSDTFYFENNSSSERVLVEGNTSSHIFLLFVHGGPGASSCFYNTDYISRHIEDKYACVYWDQRNAGASQGNTNGVDLTLAQMTDDLKKLILVIKSRYGQNSEIFILGHSFGGLLTASFMTSGNNQQMVKGWIFVDGSQNYPLNDTLTRQMLLSMGQQQIALNKHKDEWNTIVSYCNAHTGDFTFEESMQLGDYAADAETYIDEVKKVNLNEILSNGSINGNLPLTSIFFNYLYSLSANLNNELAVTQFSTSLNKVTTPTLLLFGQYDFICPQGMGTDILNHINTTDVKMVISPISGHFMMFQDEGFFCNEVNDFIENHK